MKYDLEYGIPFGQATNMHPFSAFRHSLLTLNGVEVRHTIRLKQFESHTYQVDFPV